MTGNKNETGATKRVVYALLVVVVLACAAAAFAVVFAAHPTHEGLAKVSPPRPETGASRPEPSLRCLFSDFTHASVVVGFEFKVALANGAPRFYERAEAVREDPETVFDAGERPIWSYAIDDGTPTITSPDGATRIVLYGLKLGVGGVFWTEAGIRSNDFRNLDGKCLQSHFRADGSQGAGSPPDGSQGAESPPKEPPPQ